MKNLLVTFVLILSIGNIYGQLNDYEHSPDYYLDYQVIHFEECNGNVNVYANVKPRIFKNYDISGHTFKAAVNTKSSGSFMDVNARGDIEFFNITPVNGKIDLYFQEYDTQSNLVREDWIEHKVNIVNSMVRTTRKVDSLLVEFSESKLLPNPSTLPEFFCNKEVSKIELLAFFKDYLDLTTTEMCQIIDKYNANVGNFYSPTTDYTWYSQLCTWFEEFLIEGNGGNGGDPEEEESCKCKVIEVTSAAINHTAKKVPCSNPLDDTNDCLNYEPLPFFKNYADDVIDWGEHDNELQYNELRMGAAKGAAHLNWMDGLDTSSDPVTIGTRPAISEVSYNLVCVDGNTLGVSLDSCEACVKHINFKYGYFSDAYLFVERGTNTLFNKHSSYMNIQDFAILEIQNGNNIEIDTGGFSVQGICLTNDDADTLNSRAILDGVEIVEGIFDFATGNTAATLQNAAELAIDVISFAQNNLFESGCNEIQNKYKTLLNGEKSFVLNPGDKFTATLISGATFSSYVKKKGLAFGSINSTFYMTGILLSDQAAVEAGYCKCEKVGNYVIGTVEEFSAPVPKDRDSEDGNNYDWATLYNNPSTPIPVLESIVGTFLGVTGGDWEGKFSYTCGGCDIVEIPCYSDCVYVEGCDSGSNPELISPDKVDEMEDLNKFQIMDDSNEFYGQKESKSQTVLFPPHKEKLLLYPNPTNGRITVDINGEFQHGNQINIFSSKGERWLNKIVEGRTEYIQLDLTTFPSGYYIITVQGQNRNTLSEKIIKL